MSSNEMSSHPSRSSDLPDLRRQIDKLDVAIAELLSERLELCARVGADKAEQGLPVRDPAREQDVLDRVSGASSDPSIAGSLTEIYRSVLAQSRQLQSEIAQAGLGQSTQPGVGPAYFPTVTIIGLGLIGAAIAQSIRLALPGTVITAVDRPHITAEALASGLIDRCAATSAEAAVSAGLIILAAGPRANLAVLQELSPVLRRRQVVLDVTSTKEEICRLAESMKLKSDFIGGHPLIGSAKSGWKAGLELVPAGETFALVPTARASELALRRITRWLQLLGFTPVVTSARDHDLALARTSHLVQLAVVAIGAQVAAGTSEPELRKRLSLSGPALKDLSRLMASPAELWLEIAEQNKDELVPAIMQTARLLGELGNALSHSEASQVKDTFAEALRVANILARAPESTQSEHGKQTNQACADAGQNVRSGYLQ